MTDITAPTELTASEKLQRWLDYAEKARPDLDNLLWGPGYKSAPLHSDWVKEVIAELAQLRTRLAEVETELEEIQDEQERELAAYREENS